MSSSDKVSEFKYVSEKQIISKLWTQLNAIKLDNFSKLYDEMLFKFQWDIESVWQVFCRGPGLVSTSLLSSIAV